MENYIDCLQTLEPQMIQTLKSTLKFKTVKDKSETWAPFGQENADCLSYILGVCRRAGLIAKNVDGYAGHADFLGESGEESQILGILGHLDVVPASEDGWISPPFEAEEINGEIIARGICDDKGPMIACLYAVLALKRAGFVPKKTIRLIFGCDEESGMECVKYYFKKEKMPDIAFSPDADFPCINREKGILNLEFDLGPLPSFIHNLQSGERFNVVPDEAFADLSGVQIKHLKLAEKIFGDLFSVVEKREDFLRLKTRGQSSHAAHPDLGVNAAGKLLKLLAAIEHVLHSEKGEKEAAGLTALAFAAKMHDYTGKEWGIAASDAESGALTANVGKIFAENGRLKLWLDVRHPVTHTNAQTIKNIQTQTKKLFPSATVTTVVSKEPLFVDADSPLVKTLVSVWNDFGHEGGALAIGGGTYSRCIKNCVAFGPEFPGDVQTLHQPNERMSRERLLELAKIYAEAIKRLAE